MENKVYHMRQGLTLQYFMSGHVPINSEIIFYSPDNAISPKIHVIHILLAVPPRR